MALHHLRVVFWRSDMGGIEYESARTLCMPAQHWVSSGVPRHCCMAPILCALNIPNVCATAATPVLTPACSSTGLTPQDQPWAPAGVITPQLSPTGMAAAQQAAANGGRTSFDLSSLQLALALNAAGQQPLQPFESPKIDLMRPAGNEVMHSPFARAGDGFTTGAQMQAAAVPHSMGMNPELAAALSSLTAQSSCMLLNPAAYSTPATPSPAMSRMGSAAVLGSMQSLQDAQTCCMGDTSAPLLMAASAGFAPVTLQFCGGTACGTQLLSAGALGSTMHMAPAHTASFSGVHTYSTDFTAQPRTRRHSFHVDTMSHAGVSSGMQAGVGVLGSMQGPNGVQYTVGSPTVVDASGRTIRRMSAVVGSSQSLLLGPNMQHFGCADGLQYPMQCGMSSTRGETVGVVYPAALSAAHAAACSPAASQQFSCAAQPAMLDAANMRRSFEVSSRTAGVLGRQSFDVPRVSTMADQASPFAQPRADVQEGATQPAKKGTGVFMPRVAAAPAWKGRNKGRAA